MKAIVQEGSGSADVLHVREIDKPVVTDGHVLVRVRAASVNALDWHSVHGGRLVSGVSKLMRQPDQAVRGVDVAGQVEEVGAGVTQFAPGDEVFGSAPGAFAEFALAREIGLAPKPRNASFEQAAAISVAGRTALQAIRDHAKVRPGQRVLISGAGGGVGTFAVQIAKALGAHVTALTSTRNLDLIRSLGPDEVIDYMKEDFTRREARYDSVIDVAANRSLSDLKRVLAPKGVLVLVGADKRGSVALFTRIGGAFLRSRVFHEPIVFFMAKSRQADLLELKDLIEAGKVCPAIDRTYPLSEAAEAVRYVGTGQARAKVVITMATL